MRHSCTKLQSAVMATAVSVGLAFPSAVQAASITYDLRFADGSHTRIASPGDTTLQLWVDVTGTDTDHTNDALKSAYPVVQSSQAFGGAITSGGVTSATIVAPFNQSGSQIGTGADLNGDGVQDWGSSSTNIANTHYMYVREGADTSGAAGGGTVGDAVDAYTWEFEIATFTVHVGSVGSGTTSFNVVQPNAVVNGSFPIGVYYVLGSVDNPTIGTNSNYQITPTSNTGIFALGQGVTFVPEPASLGLLGLGALGLLGRRRKRGKQ